VTQTLAILWDTFGITGLLSAAASVAAAALLAAGFITPGRFQAWLRAAALAAAAVGLATITSWSIRSIEVDRSAEVLAAEAAGSRAALDKFRGRAADIRFAEDTAADQADLAGVTVAEEEGAYERAVAEQLAKIPAYRRGGRKQRSARNPAAADATRPPEDEPAQDAAAAAEPPAAEPAPGRRLPESQLQVADRFDRLNRSLAWSLLGLATVLVGGEWVRRFNTAFEGVWPLPLAGTVIDGAVAKVHVTAPPGDLRLADFLALVARKGESFVLFAAEDPLGGRDRLDRFAVGPLRWSLPVRSCTASEVAADPGLAETVFETAWFGRGGFVVLAGPEAGGVLEACAAALERRRHCRAAARRTLNLVWALPTAPDPAVAAWLARLAAATNVRWVCGDWR
jgi:hypothetical protein